ncbi:MAG: PLP-dependent aminotransferase family protein [Pseudomonadota bacterium]
MDTKLSLPPDTGQGPLYRRLADRICAAVTNGQIAAGQQLPPVRELAWSLEISPGAVARAYKLGIERGALEAVVGRGTFARGEGKPYFAFGGLLDGRGGSMIDLRGNQAVNVGQDAEITAALARLITRYDGRLPLTEYRQREDDLDSVDVLAGWLRAGGLPAERDRLLVTSGAQAGVVAIFALLGRGGNGIALTAPTIHPGLIDGATAIGMRLEPVPADAQGVLPDALDQALARHRPDAVQISPTLHNPTLALMGTERRLAVAEVIRRHGVPVVEDDVYGRLIDAPPPSFATLLPELCWYVTSLSKCVAAGLRAGLVLTPAGQTTATLRAYQALAHQTPWLVKALAAELVQSGEAEAIRARVSRETGLRSALAERHLAPFGATTHPAGSIAFVPLPPPWSSAEFVAATAAQGVLLPPASIYRTGRIGGEFARVALGANVGRETLEIGLRRIAGILQEGPHPAGRAT